MNKDRQAADYDPLLNNYSGQPAAKREASFTTMHEDAPKKSGRYDNAGIDLSAPGGDVYTLARSKPASRKKHGPLWVVRQAVGLLAFAGTLGLLGFLAFIGFDHYDVDCDKPLALFLIVDAIEIGRAVQQECRDRSRMPSSA
eukprot:TRINITY_DN5591_c0_g1_i6.p1 TRINITY_DN5591_c0_g1~~TRINITY_DN5591_c0_g1_i6.p1  ORF type:complete len:142 (-),score=24.12 TRINITY_DN5591_c0_g1_i6:11-436(-)